MRKLLLAMPFLMFVWGMQAFAADWPFPLEKGRIWGFDDGNVDQIMFCENIETKASAIQLYVFESYNFAKRGFYREGDKIYEWEKGSRRLWYDFGVDEKASWKMEWEPVLVSDSGSGGSSEENSRKISSASGKNMKIADINNGAVMTLVEKDVKMSVPYGEFIGCFHFQITRPGVNDAAYIDEWFAPGVGCIQRVWDTIAGAHMQKLAKLSLPEPVSPISMKVSLDKEIYKTGDEINITVSVLNWSDKPDTLNFTSGLQVNYIIDDIYDFSKNHSFTTELTQVIIPPRENHTWKFTHTSADYSVPQGKHFISANIVGYKVSSGAEFYVAESQPILPEGVTLSVKTSKENYAQGEAVPFTLTVTNTTAAEVSLAFLKAKPVRYSLDDTTQITGFMEILPPVEELKIAAGESYSFDEEITSDYTTFKPGTYTLYAGLRGYENTVSTTFTVTRELSLGTVSGTVYGYNIISSSSPLATKPLPDAEVRLSLYIPKKYDGVFSTFPTIDNVELSAKSNENGEFTITNVPVGVFYIVTVTREGYYPYNETIRTLYKETPLNPILKPVQIITQQNLNYKRHELMGLSIYLGTEQTVYTPNSSINATFKITNITSDPVTFSECYVDWYLERQNGDFIKLPSNPESLPADGTGKNAEGSPSVETFILNQNESKSFEYTYNLESLAPDNGGKYSIRAALRFKECTITNLQSGDAADYITILVVPVVSQRIEANGHSNEMVVDAKVSQQACINIVTKNNDVSGQLLVTEIKENFHSPLNNKRFISMVEIDADSVIRNNMENAVIRIYFKPEELSSSSAAEKLIIAHWDDKAIDPEWKILESRVDTTNNFVEATTTSFSSFGLFENDSITAADEISVPKVFKLEQNVPNPFNPSTTIQFQLPVTGQVRLSVYNLIGQEVARLVDGSLTAGTHRFVFNGSNFGSGNYFYRITGNGIDITRKMLLLK
ncbi:MAG: BsuPI-related putative proteinase inhibitor [Candidatus Latescibacterota bacterium]